MPEQEERTFTAFAGYRCVGRGALAEAVLKAKECLDEGETDRLAVFDDATGREMEIDYRGSRDDVLQRLGDRASQRPVKKETAPTRRGPGRPKLGVVCREVSLLPRHWQWLEDQPGSISASLRRLVEDAKRKTQAENRARQIKEAAHRFMWDVAGDFAHFEEASRAFFARDYGTFNGLISDWPADIQEHLERYIEKIQPFESEAQAAL